MTERLAYRGEEYNYDNDGRYEESQLDRLLWYRLADPDYDPEEGDLEYGLEDDLEPPEELEEVEHHLDHAADDAAQLDAEVKFGWRGRVRRRREGRFVPPDVRAYRWPMFVRVADLQNRDGG